MRGLEHGVEDFVLEGKVDESKFYLCKSISGCATEFHGDRIDDRITGTWK